MLMNKNTQGEIAACVEYVYMLRSAWEEDSEASISEHVESEAPMTH